MRLLPLQRNAVHVSLKPPVCCPLGSAHGDPVMVGMYQGSSAPLVGSLLSIRWESKGGHRGQGAESNLTSPGLCSPCLSPLLARKENKDPLSSSLGLSNPSHPWCAIPPGPHGTTPTAAVVQEGTVWAWCHHALGCPQHGHEHCPRLCCAPGHPWKNIKLFHAPRATITPTETQEQFPPPPALQVFSSTGAVSWQ